MKRKLISPTVCQLSGAPNTVTVTVYMKVHMKVYFVRKGVIIWKSELKYPF